MPGRTYFAGSAYRYGFNGQEKSDEIGEGLTGALFWEYDSRIGRRWNNDPKPVVGISEYAVLDGNPVENKDPNGDCPNCATAIAGGIIGGLIGGGMELVKQLASDEKMNWKAVAGSTVQGVVTGTIAGFTGGSSLLVTATASGAANVVGGALNDAIQGKRITPGSVVKNAVLGATFGVLFRGISSTNVIVKSTAPQVEGSILNYTLQNGKVVFDKAIQNSGTFDFVLKGTKVLIGKGHYFMSNSSLVVKGAGKKKKEKGVVTAITN